MPVGNHGTGTRSGIPARTHGKAGNRGVDQRGTSQEVSFMGLDSVELVLAVEKEFGLEFSDEEAQEMITVGGMFDLIIQGFREGGGVVDEADVWKRLREIVVEQLGVKPDEVRREAEFVRDLGVD